MSTKASGQYRAHAPAGRSKSIRLRYTEEELALVAEAARCAGLTPTGYAAEAAMAAARGVAAPSVLPWRAALVELMAARTQVRRFAVNVNQAVRVLNAVGEAPAWLAAAVEVTTRAVERLDEASAAVAVIARRSARRDGTPRSVATVSGR